MRSQSHEEDNNNSNEAGAAGAVERERVCVCVCGESVGVDGLTLVSTLHNKQEADQQKRHKKSRMFGLAAGLYDSYFGTPQLNVLLLGQSGTGKTALLERIKVTRFQSNVKPNVQARIVPNTPPVTPILTKRVAVLNRSASHPSPVLNPPSLPPTGLPQDNGQSSTTTIPKDVGTETSTENAPSPVRLSFRQRLACPAPKRYANNMEADQDEEEYVSVPPVTDKEKAEEEEEEETTEKSLETTPAAAATVGKTNETATTTQPQGTTATQQAQEEEEDVEEYDVRPGQKMLPLHKIRPTSE